MHLAVQTTHGCGDLLFSSHTTFALVGVMSYQEYGTLNSIKVGLPLPPPPPLPLVST
jgi:hypothetical protein